MGLQNVRRIVLIAALLILAGTLGRWISGLETALNLAERAERAAVEAADAIAISRARAVEAERVTRAELAAVLKERPALAARVASLKAELARTREALGARTEEDDRVVEVIVHDGESHPIEFVFPDCPKPQPLDVQLGFQIGRIETAGEKSVLVGSVWADLTMEGAPAQRIEDEIAADVTEWWRAPTAEAAPTERSWWRKVDLELEIGWSWRRRDGDLDGRARLRVIGPPIRRLRRAYPWIAAEAELGDGRLLDRYSSGLVWSPSRRSRQVPVSRPQMR